MKDEGKEKTRGVAVLGVLRPDGFFYFSKYFAKMSRFYLRLRRFFFNLLSSA